MITPFRASVGVEFRPGTVSVISESRDRPTGVVRYPNGWFRQLADDVDDATLGAAILDAHDHSAEGVRVKAEVPEIFTLLGVRSNRDYMKDVRRVELLWSVDGTLVTVSPMRKAGREFLNFRPRRDIEVAETTAARVGAAVRVALAVAE